MSKEPKDKAKVDIYNPIATIDPFDASLEVAKIMVNKIQNITYSLTMLDFDNIGMVKLTKEQHSSILELLLFCRTARDKFNSLQTSWYIFDSIIVSVLDGINYGLDFEIYLKYRVLSYIENRLQNIETQIETDIDELRIAERRKDKR